MEQDATAVCGPRYGHKDERRQAHRWGQTPGKIGFHGGKVALERPRVRGARRPGAGAAKLGERRSRRPAGPLGAESDADQRLDPPVWPRGAAAGGGYSGHCRCRNVEVCGVAPLRGAVCGTAEGVDGGRAVELDLLVIQIDGIHMENDLVLLRSGRH